MLIPIVFSKSSLKIFNGKVFTNAPSIYLLPSISEYGNIKGKAHEAHIASHIFTFGELSTLNTFSSPFSTFVATICIFFC